MSFDSFPILYWIVGYCIFFLLAVITLKKEWNTLPFLILGGIGLIMMRLPVVLFNHELNQDESQVIANALTLRENPIFWQSVDGTTIGPLDIYLLTFVKLFGGPIDYTTAHATALGCALVSFVFFYLAITNLFNSWVAKLGSFPLVLFLAFTQEVDFIHYTSEQLPLVILSLSLWLGSIIYKNDSPQNATVFFTGFLLGMVPFAKLQASFQAIFLSVFLLGLLVQRKQFQHFFTLILGGLTFPILVLVFLISFHLTNDFIAFYIQGNVIYANSGNSKNLLLQFIEILQLSPDFLKYLGSIAGLVLLGMVSLKKGSYNWLIAFCVGWIIISIYAITKSGNPFVHYLNLLTYPLALLGAIFVAQISKPTFKTVAAFLPLLIWASFFVPKAVKRQPFNRYISNADHRLPQSNIAKKILEYAQPKDMLVVWGWACQYYVETQLPEGTAEPHSSRCIYEHPMRQNYRNRYIADMRRNGPAVFVDAIGKNSLWLQDISSQGHQNFPELKAFIDTNYSLVDTLDDVRIYVLKERLKPAQ